MKSSSRDTPLRSRLDAILDEIEEFLEDQEDVRDGEDGVQLPNTAMSLLQGLRDARTLLPATASHKDNLRSLLGGLEVENVDELMEKDNPILFRVIGEKIARAAKLGAHLVPTPDWP